MPFIQMPIEEPLAGSQPVQAKQELEEQEVPIRHSTSGDASESYAVQVSESETTPTESFSTHNEYGEREEGSNDDDGYESYPEHEIIYTSEREDETNSNPYGVAEEDRWCDTPKRDDTYFQQEGWKEVGLTHEESLALERQTVILHVPRRLQFKQPGRVNKCLRDIHLKFPTESQVLNTGLVRNVRSIHISAPAHYKITTFYCQNRSLNALKKEIADQTTLGAGGVIQVRDTENVIALLHYFIPPEPVVPKEVNGYLEGKLLPGRVTWVESEEEYTGFLTYLHQVKKNTVELALDCEASRGLSRKGNVTHLTISIKSLDHTWVLCHTKLPQNYFDIPYESTGKSLRSLLEDPEIQQLWFDVRSDSDALFGIYGIRLGCVIDVQFMEVAARYGDARLRPGLSSLKLCMSTRGYGFLSKPVCDQWLYDKSRGREFFRVHGFEILEEDPLPEEARDYTAGDTYILFGLYDQYEKDCKFIGKCLEVDLGGLVEEQSRLRVKNSQDPEYDHNGLTIAEKTAAPAVFLKLDFVEADGERTPREVGDNFHQVKANRFFGGAC